MSSKKCCGYNFGKGMREVSPGKAQIVHSSMYVQLLHKEGSIQCLELLGACAREASASDPVLLGTGLPQEERNEAHGPEWLQRNHP